MIRAKGVQVEILEIGRALSFYAKYPPREAVQEHEGLEGLAEVRKPGKGFLSVIDP